MKEFQKLMNNPIVDEIWESEKEDFEMYILEHDSERKGFYIDAKSAGELETFIEKNIPEDKLEEYQEKYRNYCLDITKETEYWIKKYFRSGFYDGIRFYNEINDYMSEKQEKEDTFFNYNLNCFTEYIETMKMKKLLFNPEYKRLKKQIADIKVKYPRVQSFFEEEIINNITDEEQKAIITIRNLETMMEIIADKVVYKLGMCENTNPIKF